MADRRASGALLIATSLTVSWMVGCSGGESEPNTATSTGSTTGSGASGGGGSPGAGGTGGTAGPTPTLVLPGPLTQFAVDDDGVYGVWYGSTDYNGKVVAAARDGSGWRELGTTDQIRPRHIAAGGPYVFVTYDNTTVWRFPKAGGEREMVFQDDGGVSQPTVVGDDLYVKSSNHISRMPVSGGSPVVTVQDGTIEEYVVGADAIHFTTSGEIKWAPLVGMPIEIVAENVYGVYDIAVADGYVYWLQCDPTTWPSVMRVPWLGGEPETVYARDDVCDPNYESIAAYDGALYWARVAEFEDKLGLYRLPLAAPAEPIRIAPQVGIGDRTKIVIDEGTVFWLDGGFLEDGRGVDSMPL